MTVDFAQSAFTTIMGPSGSGKSTLIHCVAGLDQLTSGSVSVGGTELSHLNEKELTRLRRDHVGFVFQAFSLIPTLTVEENIKLPAALAKSRPEASWFNTVIDTVGLGDRLAHRPEMKPSCWLWKRLFHLLRESARNSLWTRSISGIWLYCSLCTATQENVGVCRNEASYRHGMIGRPEHRIRRRPVVRCDGSRRCHR